MVQRHIIPCLKLIYVWPFVGFIFWNLQNVTETFEIQDERKCISLPAIDIFKHAIKALKDHFEEAAKDRGVVFKPEEVLYVLTVPAIWSESAKEFMKKAAIKVIFSIFLHFELYFVQTDDCSTFTCIYHFKWVLALCLCIDLINLTRLG